MSDITTTKADPFFYGWRFVWKKDQYGAMQEVQQPLTFEDVLHPEEGDYVMTHTAHSPALSYLEEILARTSRSLEGVRILREVRIDWGIEGLGVHVPDLILFVHCQPEEHPVGTFKPKDHGATPLVVIEVSSPSTRIHDLDSKVNDYYRAGVQFYAVIDLLPERDLREGIVYGFETASEGFTRLPLDSQGRLWVALLGFWLACEDGKVVCYDSRGERMLSNGEQARRTETRVEELEQMTEEAILARRVAEKQSADLAALVAQLQAQLAQRTEPS